MKLPHQTWEDSYIFNRTPWREMGVDISPIIDRTGINKGVALDLGCGTGEWSVALAEAGFGVEAIDFSSEALKIARSQSNKPTWIEWDLEKLADYNFNHPKYDLILDMKVLAFIENKITYLDVIKSRLQGYYVLSVFHVHSEKPAICVPIEEFNSLIEPHFVIKDKIENVKISDKESVTYFLSLLKP